MAPSFVSKLRSLVSLSRSGRGKARRQEGRGEEGGREYTGSEDEENAGEGGSEDDSQDEDEEAGHGSEEEDDDDDGLFFDPKTGERKGDLLEAFDETGLTASLRFAVRKIFEKKGHKDALTMKDKEVLDLSHHFEVDPPRDRSNAKREKAIVSSFGPPGARNGKDGARHFSRNPYFHLCCLVGSCLDKSLHLLIRKDFIAAMNHLDSVGALPETVSPNSPLCRSTEYRPQGKGRDGGRGHGAAAVGGDALGRLRGARRRGGGPSSAAKYGPACWGLPHTVFGMDRRRLKILRETIESAGGCQRAFQFSLTLSEFNSEDLDTLEGPRKKNAETFLLSTMVSIQRTTLGSFSSRLDHTKTISEKLVSLTPDIPAVIGLQEDVVVSGSYLTGALATFVQHMLLQIQDLMDTKLHVVEGLYVTDKPIQAATFRVNRFDEDQNVNAKQGGRSNRGIRFGLFEMFDTLEFTPGEGQATTKTSLTFVKAIKRAVLQQKIITLSAVLHVNVDKGSSKAGEDGKEKNFPKRLMRVVKRYVFHHDTMDEAAAAADAIAHYSGDPFEAIYSGIFLSQKAVRRYLQLYQHSPMDAVVFEPNLAKRKEMISEFLSQSHIGSALCETLSFALLEWSQDVYNTQNSVSARQLHQIIRVIVDGPGEGDEEEEEEEEFDEYHMSLLSAVVELVLLDCSLSSQIAVVSNSAEVVLDILGAEMKDDDGDEISFLRGTSSPKKGDPEAEKKKAVARRRSIHVIETIKRAVEKGNGFDFLMDHVHGIVKCLDHLDHLGILDLASSSEDSKIVGKSLSKTMGIVMEDPGHAFLLINQLYRAAHLIKACSNVLSTGFLLELNATKDLLMDVRSKYLSGRRKPSNKQDKKSKRTKVGSGETKEGAENGGGGGGRGASEEVSPSYPLAVSPMEKAQPGILENLQRAANAGLEIVLGGLVWNILQPPIPVDPYPKCIKLLKGAASALEIIDSDSIPEKDVLRCSNQLTMLGNDQRIGTNPLFPVYLTIGGAGKASVDAVYGSYTALQYCGLESARSFTSLLMEQVLGNMGEIREEEDMEETPLSNLWHFFAPKSFRRGSCNVDIVQSIDGSMSISGLALLSENRTKETGGHGENLSSIGLRTVCEYYLVRGSSADGAREASAIFADDVIKHIRAYVAVGQSHVLENTIAKRKGGLILDIQVNHPDFLYEDKQKLLSKILNANYLKGASVRVQGDPFRHLLEKAGQESLSAGKTDQIVSILVAQEHPKLGYVPVVKSIYLSYASAYGGRAKAIPVEAHSQVFIDEVSALTWHNWFDRTSYNASCADFVRSLSRSRALGIEGDGRNAEQLTSSLYTLKFFSKAFDSLTQLYVDTLRACIACQEAEGIAFLSKVIGAECYASISRILTSTMLLEAFLDGKSIHIDQLLTTDMHGEMLRRIKLVFEDLVESIKDTLDQDWSFPNRRPIQIFLHKSPEIKDTIMRGSFDFAASHVKSVLMWAIECSNYVSSGINISCGDQVTHIMDRLSQRT